MEALQGYKTYLTVGLGVVCYGLLAMGYIDQGTFETVAGLCALLGIGFLKAGVNRELGRINKEK